MNRKTLKNLVMALTVLSLGISSLVAMAPVAAKVDKMEARLADCRDAARSPTVDPTAFLAGSCHAGDGRPVCQY